MHKKNRRYAYECCGFLFWLMLRRFFSDHFCCGLEKLTPSSILKGQGDLACINANF